MTKTVNPWELIHDKTISQLVFAYEAILTEMRTHAKADRTIRGWVERLDFERDEFVTSMLVKPDEPSAPLTYSEACDLLARYAVALQDRQCGDEFQPQYMAALKACTDAMGVQPENREPGQ